MGKHWTQSAGHGSKQREGDTSRGLCETGLTQNERGMKQLVSSWMGANSSWGSFFPFFLKMYLFYFYVCMCLHVCMLPQVCRCPERLKRLSDALELELPGDCDQSRAENRTSVLFRSCTGSQPPVFANSEGHFFRL